MTRSATAPLAVVSLTLLASFGSLATAAVLHDDPAGSARHDSAAAPSDTIEADLSLASAPARLSPADSCDDLLALLHEKGSKLVGPWGWDQGWGRWGFAYRSDLSTGSIPRAAGDATHTTEQSNSVTGTNIQESGIDEPDIAKTTGDLLVRVDGRRLTTYDVSGDEVRKVGSLRLPEQADQPELLLRGDRLLVLGATCKRDTVHTRVIGIDLSDPTAPRAADVHEFEGALLSARLTGGDVRMVVSTGLPRLDFVMAGRWNGEKVTRKEARRENRRIVQESTIEDWLPRVTDDGAASPLVGCSDVQVPEEIRSLGTLSVVGFPFDAPTQRDTTAVLTDSQIAYTSADRLYLATSGWQAGFSTGSTLRRSLVSHDTTDLHAFALAGTEATYLGSGRLKGTVSDRWSLDSADGVLRVALAVPARKSEQTGKRVKRHNAVVTMREANDGLEEIGRVDRLGVNEDIQSVRWFDDFAVMVTFRQVDPLYAIDLTSPDDPRLLGELKIPGFSSYLHPIGDDRLLGIGTDATLRGRSLGPQASTFDVADPAALAQLAKVAFGKRAELPAAQDPRQFTWLADRSTALTPVFTYRGSYRLAMSVLEVSDDGSLAEKRFPLRGAWQAAYDVRTLPLADGRVVVSSSKETRFLDW